MKGGKKGNILTTTFGLLDVPDVLCLDKDDVACFAMDSITPPVLLTIPEYYTCMENTYYLKISADHPCRSKKYL